MSLTPKCPNTRGKGDNHLRAGPGGLDAEFAAEAAACEAAGAETLLNEACAWEAPCGCPQALESPADNMEELARRAVKKARAACQFGATGL
jgi:hypothetical protein